MQDDGRYRTFNSYLRERFGRKVYRVGIYGGFTCPNRDGSLDSSGCTFCNPASSEPLNFRRGMTVTEQLAAGTEYISRRHGASRFIAYFQDYTATYAPADELAELYEEALAFPGIVGLALGTRPDCLPGPVLSLLGRLAARTMLWVELGVQSANDATLERIRRGHDAACSARAVTELKSRGVLVTAHVIAGLPGEGEEELLDTARFLAEHGVDGVKLHNLHVVSGTALAEEYARGTLPLLSMEQYAAQAVAFIEHVPRRTIFQRLTGEAPKRLTIAPRWSVNKLAVLNAIKKRLVELDSWQGKALGEPRPRRR